MSVHLGHPIIGVSQNHLDINLTGSDSNDFMSFQFGVYRVMGGGGHKISNKLNRKVSKFCIGSIVFGNAHPLC